MQEARLERVRVTVLCGFLGAGKTSFLRHVLSSPRGLRVAVVQNEISALRGIETATVVGDRGNTFLQYVELPNGCVCCTVRDELPVAIERLVEINGGLDAVLVECTGLALPGPVASSLWLDDELESAIVLDGIVTMVDSHRAFHQLRTARECCTQIAAADCLILNKIDGCDETHLADLTAALRQLNGLAPILRAAHARVPIEVVLGLDAYAPTSRSAQLTLAVDTAVDAAVASLPGCLTEYGRCNRGDVCDAADGRAWLHTDGTFSMLNLSEAQPLSLPRLRRFLAELLWENTWGVVYRSKASLRLAGEHCAMYSLQGVHDTFELAPVPNWPLNSAQTSEIVLIGRNLERVALRRALAECQANVDVINGDK